MRNLLFAVAAVAAVAGLWACDGAPTTTATGEAEGADSLEIQKVSYYGEKIDEGGTISPQELKEKLKTAPEYNGKFTGEVVEVCKAEGCWLTLDAGDGTSVMVMMQDHAFTVPKDIEGRTAIVKGRAYMDTTSVEQLKHFALDKGKSQEEIDKITEPEVSLMVDATGVILK